MILPIREYATQPKNNARSVKVRPERTACVAFRITAPALHVELHWNSSDDFDLNLVEPDGDMIGLLNQRKTEAGKLNGDNSKGFCNINLPKGKENIVYFPGGPIERGRYEFFVEHATKCSPRPTKWVVKVLKRGKVVLVKSGMSRRLGKERREVVNGKFRYP